MIPVSVLRNEPFSLSWGTSVYAKLIATNIEGDSIESNEGNGAMIIRDPDAPSNLIETYAQRTPTTLGLEWTAEFNGGTPILDYSISISYNDGNFQVLATTTDTSFTVVSLTPGDTYQFKV